MKIVNKILNNDNSKRRVLINSARVHRLITKRSRKQRHLIFYHYENLSMQYEISFISAKFENIIGNVLIFLIFLLKTLIVCTRWRGGPNEYTQSMLWIKIKKKMYTAIRKNVYRCI